MPEKFLKQDLIPGQHHLSFNDHQDELYSRFENIQQN